ncbi:DEAD/DEAH box helicase [Actinocrinis puniceicyclus]|uniref:DEAD/DEAH box helicase n=1 Tax=Actinocrinis puniceicyclus TaxID=977794 RepID=A0A8J7WM00_9ACTN|nr:DEAD/DEAH box helicase [Actinocrinis puniceicyclus]MBS2964858.1 DEAD/DEAH box helicase [Actinocrinis puniceicyclus]
MSAATSVATSAVVSTATFAELGVPEVLTGLLRASGITVPFPIQAATLPDSMAGRDVLGRGRTGSGKTLGFLLPVLTRLAATPRKRRPNRPRALILAPTRELATQIHDAAKPLADALGLRTAVVFGGVSARPQISALRSGIDLVIACPGRLLDHVGAGHAILDAIEITVLDEADHMADLGFLPMVKRILDATPAGGQRLLFSATLDNGIDQLVRRYLSNPVTHAVDSQHSEIPDMTHHVLHIDAEHRLPILIELATAPGRTIVFTRTKHGARKLARQLAAARVPAVELHGNLAQNARTRNLAAFSQGQATTLVATDIAARGIHVDDVSLVVHADPPVEHKAYLHRSGRTARAGNSGTVITLMTDAQVGEVRDLTRKARITATTTRLAPGDPLIGTLAPGERSLADPARIATLTGSAADLTRPGPAGIVPSAGKPAQRRRRGSVRSGSGDGHAAGAARKSADSVAAAGSARSGGKPVRASGAPSAGSGGAAKASQRFRGRAR